MKNLLAVIGDGNAAPVLEAALLTARRFNSHVVGRHSLTTEYAVVFGDKMGFKNSSDVDRTFEREGHDRRDLARRLFGEFMGARGVHIGPLVSGYDGPSASWLEEGGRQNALVGVLGRVYDLICQPASKFDPGSASNVDPSRRWLGLVPVANRRDPRGAE